MSNTRLDNHQRTTRLVQISLLTALVVVLQLVSSLFGRINIPFSLVLIPIVIGGAALGVRAGAFLGAVFGFITLICGFTGLDVFTNMMITYKPLATVCICFIKGICAGIAGALVYKLFIKLFKNKIYPASIIAFAVVPVVNTGIFATASALFFADFFDKNFGISESNTILLVGAIFAFVIVNFLVEFLLNVIGGPIITTLLSKNKNFKNLLHK